MSSSIISSSIENVASADSKSKIASSLLKDNTTGKINIETTTTKDTYVATLENCTSSVSTDPIGTEENLESSRKKLLALTNNALNACDNFFISCDQANVAVNDAINTIFAAEEAILNIVAASEKIKALTNAISIDSEHMTGENMEIAENAKKMAHDNIKKARNDFIKTITQFREAVSLVTEAEDRFIDSMFSEETSDAIASITHHSTNTPEIDIGEKRKIDSVSEEDEKENKKPKI